MARYLFWACSTIIAKPRDTISRKHRITKTRNTEKLSEEIVYLDEFELMDDVGASPLSGAVLTEAVVRFMIDEKLEKFGMVNPKLR